MKQVVHDSTESAEKAGRFVLHTLQSPHLVSLCAGDELDSRAPSGTGYNFDGVLVRHFCNSADVSILFIFIQIGTV